RAKQAALERMPPGVPVLRVEDLRLSVKNGSIAARFYCNSEAPLAVLVWMHGGGFVLGNIASYDNFCRQLARRTHAVVFSVEYRLAPEYPFPIPLDDAISAITWIATEGEAIFGTAKIPLFVGGDSAGGNLATVAARL